MKLVALDMNKFSFLIFISCCSFCFSQVKAEREERIKAYEFPESTQGYFDFISKDAKYLKFYKETDGENQSFEAKLKVRKFHYSIEFDTLGKLEDIEIVIKKKHISKKVLNAINSYFNSNFKKTRFIKIQKQYVNYNNESDKFFIQHIIENPNDKHTSFEIIAEIKTEMEHELMEFTFNRKGTFEKSRLVTSSSYEHALY